MLATLTTLYVILFLRHRLGLSFPREEEPNLYESESS